MKLWKRLRYFLGRQQFEQELAEEVRSHREMAGATFGSAALALEDSRAVWRIGWLDSLLQDTRYALRGFSKSPGFSLTVIGTIALALGLNSTLFTVLNAYALRPLPVSDPYSLYTFLWTTTDRMNHRFTWPEYQELRRQNVAFGEVLGYQNGFAAMAGRGSLVQVVTGNYFSSLGAGMWMGRPILERDCAPGIPPVTVASYATWENRLNADPNVLGKVLYLNGTAVEVVGVARPEFRGLEPLPPEFWLPLTLSGVVANGPDLFGPERPGRLTAIGRLRPDVTPAIARSALMAWSQQMTLNQPAAGRATGVLLEQHATPLGSPRFINLLPIFAAFGLVLFMACANVSNMMLARALAREREMGIRLSLGAGRARLMRQMLTESLLLALPGAGLGYVLGAWTLEMARRILFATAPVEFTRVLHLVDLSPDLRVFEFMLAGAVAATVMFGLAPAVYGTRPGRDKRPARLRNRLLVAQVTVCAVLLIVTMVILRSEQRLVALDMGLDTHRVFDLRVSEKYRVRVAEQLRQEPAVEPIAAAAFAPLNGSLPTIEIAVGGSAGEHIDYDVVSPEYFDVFRIPLLRGRNFSATEANGTAVAIVSQTAARLFWPDANALGQTVTSRLGQATVIGIARDAINGAVGNGPRSACIYFPTNVRATGVRALLVRVKTDPTAGARAIQAAADRVASSIVEQMTAMDHVVAFQRYPFLVTLGIAAFLGGLALALTVLGIYGMLSYLVNQRTREIGIRIALGAQRASVVRLVLRQSFSLASIGTGAGMILALVAARFFAHQIEVVDPYELTAYASGAVLVLAAALGAAFFPSRRAAGIDPATTLRGD